VIHPEISLKNRRKPAGFTLFGILQQNSTIAYISRGLLGGA
jgi:hypothetical protein